MYHQRNPSAVALWLGLLLELVTWSGDTVGTTTQEKLRNLLYRCVIHHRLPQWENPIRRFPLSLCLSLTANMSSLCAWTSQQSSTILLASTSITGVTVDWPETDAGISTGGSEASLNMELGLNTAGCIICEPSQWSFVPSSAVLEVVCNDQLQKWANTLSPVVWPIADLRHHSSSHNASLYTSKLKLDPVQSAGRGNPWKEGNPIIIFRVLLNINHLGFFK